MTTIRARWYGEGRSVPIRLVVIHDMEAPEGPHTAENVAAWFSRLPASQKASAHVCVDNNSTVRCVDDSDRAWHAPGANSDGLGLEIAGYARQTRAEWLDAYSKAALEQAAAVTADWCTRYGIPVRRLSVSELTAGKKGIVGHHDVSAAYHQTDHTDPGPNFPWDHFLDRVNAHMGTTPPKYEPFPGSAFFREGRNSQVITAMGKRLVAEGCGRYQVGPGPRWSEADRKSYAAWQRKLGYSGSGADGIPGRTSWDKLKVPKVG